MKPRRKEVRLSIDAYERRVEAAFAAAYVYDYIQEARNFERKQRTPEAQSRIAAAADAATDLRFSMPTALDGFMRDKTIDLIAALEAIEDGDWMDHSGAGFLKRYVDNLWASFGSGCPSYGPRMSRTREEMTDAARDACRAQRSAA